MSADHLPTATRSTTSGITPAEDSRPNVLFVMTDQQRFDTIASHGNSDIYTPNLDRLAKRGVAFDNAYATCPVCVPSRYTIMSGSEPTRTNIYDNELPEGSHETIVEKCGGYLPAEMSRRGYRTWGVGKFHTIPWNAELGFELQLRSEELYETPEARLGDAFAAWIAAEHPAFNWIEALMGERTDMYYMPQMSALPAALTVESWATDRALEQLAVEDTRPWFGFVSYIGPHPPFAPPLPYNRMYDPDRMPSPVSGDLAVDHLDQQIPWMNHAVYAERVDDNRARTLKARYYGEITYIDSCIGRILDGLEASGQAENTLICFYADHGDLLGDHSGWQKESFFEASARVPFLVSWPARIAPSSANHSLVCLTDLFGIATSAAGDPDFRQGFDVLGIVDGSAAPRDALLGFHGTPGTERFKAMVRRGPKKLIWMANGGKTLLFDVESDPYELQPIRDREDIVADLTEILADELRREGVSAAFSGDALLAFPYTERELLRFPQFDRARGVEGFPTAPADVHFEPAPYADHEA
ncbi:sulfatase family protein [Demequina aurantiaca]|uniref:sulfatase family protein n=1 Tax=Demequina aurantiaca TaxID=676200 RepID=UPI0007855F91|nr:sulfatase-like hydrolase/transferase [Demequina aurantiaca]